MAKLKVIILFSAIFLIIFTLHLFGYFKGLYYSLHFYDKILHLSAGAYISAIIIWVLFKTKIGDTLKTGNRFTKLILTIALTITIGALWEFLEFFWDSYFANKFGLPPLQINNTDTILDLIFDTIGTILTVGSYYLITSKSKLFKRFF